jgi:death-on-curing protein
VDHVLAIHAQQVERFGGSHGVLHPGALESAVARSGNRFHYESAGLAELAAAYLVGLIRAHAFIDANKRTGTASMLVFLRINGHRLHVPQTELYALAMDVANGRRAEPQVAAWIRERL